VLSKKVPTLSEVDFLQDLTVHLHLITTMKSLIKCIHIFCINNLQYAVLPVFVHNVSSILQGHGSSTARTTLCGS